MPMTMTLSFQKLGHVSKVIEHGSGRAGPGSVASGPHCPSSSGLCCLLLLRRHGGWVFLEGDRLSGPGHPGEQQPRLYDRQLCQ